MARFYGTIQGARGPTSRLGHASSGLSVTAQSYSGDICVSFHASENKENPDPVNWVEISARPHGGGPSVILYTGPISNLLEGHKSLIERMAFEGLQRDLGNTDK